MRRTIAVVFIVAGLIVVATAAMALTTNDETKTTPARGTVKRVVVSNDNGDVTVRTGGDASVKRTERWNFVRPSYSQDVSDGTLTVRAKCPNVPLNNCAVDLVLQVPTKAAVQTRTVNGDVHVDGISGSPVTVTSTNGDLTLTDLATASLGAETTNGDIDVALGERPDKVDLSSTNGDIDAVLPKGSYDIQTRTTNGDVSVKALDDDSSSRRKVSVSTTNGDIALRGN